MALIFDLCDFTFLLFFVLGSSGSSVLGDGWGMYGIW